MRTAIRESVRVAIRSSIRTSGGGGGGAVDWRYKFDGIDDYIQLPTINLSIGDTVTFKFTALLSRTPSSFMYIMDGINSSNRFGIAFGNSSNVWYSNGSYSFTVDGVSKSPGDAIPLDGLEHVVVCTMSQALVLATVGSRFTHDYVFESFVWDIQVNDGAVYNYQVNDGWSVNPAISNTGSGANATLINAQESGWYEV